MMLAAINMRSFFCITLLSFVVSSVYAQTNNTVHIYNWLDYIAPDTIKKFEQETGIDVIYDTFEDLEEAEQILLKNKHNYDIVFSYDSFLSRLARSMKLAPLNKKLLPNYKNLDPNIYKKFIWADVNQQFLIPYLWGTLGIGYNVTQIQKVLGQGAVIEGWQSIFEPANLERLSQCGIGMLDSRNDIMAITLHLSGKNPYSLYQEDYTEIAFPFLQALRPHIKYIKDYESIKEFKAGKLCIVINWSGDILQVVDTVLEGETPLRYIIPQEGSIIAFDGMAIPSNAKNKANAHKFINFILRPDIIAEISTYVAYPNINKAAAPFMAENLLKNLAIYPPLSIVDKLIHTQVIPPRIDRIENHLWQKFKGEK